MSCRKTPTSAGRSPTCWPLAAKNNSHRSILSDSKKHESSAVSTRKSSAQNGAKKHTSFGMVKVQLNFCQQGQHTNTFAQLRYKKHFDQLLNRTKANKLRPPALQIRISRILLSTPLLQSTTPTRRSPSKFGLVAPRHHVLHWQRCRTVPTSASGRLGPHRCFSRHQETLRSMRRAYQLV